MIDEIKFFIREAQPGDEVLDINNIVAIKWRIGDKWRGESIKYFASKLTIDVNELCEVLDSIFKEILKNPTEFGKEVGGAK